MAMVQRKFYFPQDMYADLKHLAYVSKKTITQVLREIVNEGLKKRKRHRKPRGTPGILRLAELAEREGWSDREGKTDVAKNHNKYVAEAIEQDLKRIHDQYR